MHPCVRSPQLSRPTSADSAHEQLSRGHGSVVLSDKGSDLGGQTREEEGDLRPSAGGPGGIFPGNFGTAESPGKM